MEPYTAVRAEGQRPGGGRALPGGAGDPGARGRRPR